ncbi:MAG: CopG family transcriptional regulator [Clostridia bacterium]|nr:CopG family transcriptional regulator [Clostridia bacterium]
MSELKSDVLKLKKRGEDGNRVITVRIKEETLSEIDRIAKEVNYSRNELINTILEHGVRTIEIE